MLKQLRIQNIILIEREEIPFELGFNVLSGETGAGKSAIMHALSLILGERADSTIIRKGEDKGVVEAVIDIDRIPHLHKLLEDSGIDHHKGDDLIIRREISASSKSRAFINNQMAQQALLRKVGESLVDMIGQHANQRLLSIEMHRDILDLFAELQDAVKVFGRSWEEENAIRSKLEKLINSESERIRTAEVCRMELEEIEEGKLKEGEDEELFAEYTLLSNSEELADKSHAILQALNGEKSGVLPLLNRQKSNFDSLSAMDPSLDELSKTYTTALIELQEVAYSLNQYRSRVEHNPQQTAKINARLSLIARLKKKYGATISEIQNYQEKVKEKLRGLEGTDEEIEELGKKLAAIEKQNEQQAKCLTAKRSSACKQFEDSLILQLRALNMPKVEFFCKIMAQKRTKLGDDKIEFFLRPNVGEREIPIRECASGGELSRLMLAIQALLAGKAQIPILVFDEIDSNIGGETAVVVGDKLREIGMKHQVLCITHFPQVAKQAQHHLCISKTEKEGRTVTKVQALDAKGINKELSRMQGNQAVLV